MSLLRHLDQAAHLADPTRKQAYVTTMFEEIAPRYDAFTRRFSYGMDVGWKAELIGELRVQLRGDDGTGIGLDLACGTGDLARSIAGAFPALRVRGIDVSPTMVRHAQAHPRVEFSVGDACHLVEPDRSVALVTIGYGLRNFPSFRRGLAEIHRVLIPGGTLGILEFTLPENPLWRRLFLSYLWAAGMWYGWSWHGHGPTYGYIARSIELFTSRRGLESAVTEAGFDVVSSRSHLGGGIVVMVARKRP